MVSPKRVTSYCDLRFGTGKLYDMLGFELHSQSKPNYFYIDGMKRLHRYSFAKHKLVQKGYSVDLTESQIAAENGYLKIYDCGNKKYIWSV